MGGPNYDDYAVLPGWTGDGISDTAFQVYLLAPSVASGPQIFPTLDSGVVGIKTMGWLTFSCDDGAGNPVPFFLTIQGPGIVGAPPSPATPNPTEYAASGSGNEDEQCIFVPAGKDWSRRFWLDQEFNALQITDDPAYLRVELTTAPY